MSGDADELTSAPGAPSMPLRDEFAAAAVSGLLTSPQAQTAAHSDDVIEHDRIAIAAYRIADAMLRARRK